MPAMTATVTQHDRHAVRCGCATMHVAARPDGVPDTTVSYGPNLQAWCVYLMVAHAVPVARCADLVAALTGSRPSDGFVHALIARAAAGVAESNRIIRTLIILAHVVSCDETPIRVGARKVEKYLLVACTHLYSWYLLGDRSLDTFEVFVLRDLTGVIVHDRYQNYDAKIFAHLVHQLCVAHLIRDCQDAAGDLPRCALAGPGPPGPARTPARREPRPRTAAARHSRAHRRSADRRLPARRADRAQGGRPGTRP